VFVAPASAGAGQEFVTGDAISNREQLRYLPKTLFLFYFLFACRLSDAGIDHAPTRCSHGFVARK